jgi:antitoxin (DNA-binding transcriptional repressor) of toxin-antitoxin stability system
MRAINIHEGKTQLSRLVEEAAKGESFAIAKADKPMVKVSALDAPEPKAMQRFGFMRDVGTSIPEDFDRMFDAEIEALFGLRSGVA